MRFNYGEKIPERLEIATDVASNALELPNHCMTLNERLWESQEHHQHNLMSILATRSGILSAASAAYVLGDNNIFKACALFLVSKGKDLAGLVQTPCIPGEELSLAILIDHPSAAKEIARAILDARWQQPLHPEDYKALFLAMLTLGRIEDLHMLACSSPSPAHATKEDLRGLDLWKELIKGLPEAETDRLRAIQDHENRLVRLQLSKLARGKESCLCAADLVCFSLQALLVMYPAGEAPA